MKITSVNNQMVKDVVKLHKKKNRDKEGLFLLEGYHLFEEAKKHGVIKNVFTTDESIKGTGITYVTDQVMEKLAQTKNPQGVLTVCSKLIKNEITDRVLILNNVQDPGNLGTLLRSALAFNFLTVILDNTCDLYNDKVIRSTQGNIFRLNIINMDTMEFIKRYSDYTVYGTSMNGTPIEEIKSEEKVALVLGNEGSGVSPEILNNTDINLTIETNIESLNVAVAGSIIMHHINKI